MIAIPSNVVEAQARGGSFYAWDGGSHSSEGEIELVEGKRTWIQARNVSICIGLFDEGVSIDVYPAVFEDQDPIHSRLITFAEIAEYAVKLGEG